MAPTRARKPPEKAPRRKPGTSSKAARARRKAPAPVTASLAVLEARLRAQLGKSDEAAWRAGKVFDTIARSGKYLDAGFTDLEGYADARFQGYGYSTLRRYRRVAVRFTLREVKRWTLGKLALVLAYLESLSPKARRTPLSRLRIAHPDGREIPFAEISAELLEEIIRLRAAASGGGDASPADKALPRGGRALLERATEELGRLQRDTVPQPTVEARTVRDEKRHAVVLFTVRDLEGEILARLLDGVRRRSVRPRR